MAGTDPKVAGLPAFPGVGAARNPQQLPAGARQMMGVPVTGVQPSTQAGGQYDVRPSDSGKA